MDPLRFGLTTQTPLVKFQPATGNGPAVRANGSLRLRVDQPYRLTPGGVCRMLYPTLRSYHEGGVLRQADWLSLQPGAPNRVEFEGLPITLHHLEMPPDELAAYARTKEQLWADIHGLPQSKAEGWPKLGADDFRFYARLNGFAADRLLAAAPDLDVAYIHDFQLLLTGALLGLSAPAVLRWHVPFIPGLIPQYTRQFLVHAMENFDLVMVSTRRDLEGLANAGFHGRVRQVYPHIDPREWPDVPASRIAAFEERWGLQASDFVFVVVARMDPMKRQDLAIRAFARIAKQHPRARLLVVGNGSFSNARKGGLGLDKATVYHAELDVLVAELGVQEKVVFTGWVPEEEVAAAYARSQAVLLPSDVEGFGLTVLEAWRYRRAVIVSSGCGVAEIIHPWLNGAVFRLGDDEDLAACMRQLITSPATLERLGESGWLTLPQFTVRAGAAQELDCLREAIHAFRA